MLQAGIVMKLILYYTVAKDISFHNIKHLWIKYNEVTKGHKKVNTLLLAETYPHDLASLFYILPHRMDNVATHILSFSAFLSHPHQTHPAEEIQHAIELGKVDCGFL